jgi:hypothetical protein
MNFKKVFLGLVLALSLATAASAHSVTLSWTKSTDDTGASGQGYTIYRLTGACTASNTTSTTGFTALNTSLLEATTFTDTTVGAGTYCYVLTFTSASTASAVSNPAQATVPVAPPTNVQSDSSN